MNDATSLVAFLAQSQRAWCQILHNALNYVLGTFAKNQPPHYFYAAKYGQLIG